MPVGAPNPPRIDVKVTATQSGFVINDVTIKLQPPPVLFIHGVWSSAAEAKFAPGSGGMLDWFGTVYPHSLLAEVDYGGNSAESFADRTTQNELHKRIHTLLSQAAASSVAARQVDVVAHSMGGLVTRYFLDGVVTRQLK